MTDSIVQFLKFFGIGAWNTIFDIVLWKILLKFIPESLINTINNLIHTKIGYQYSLKKVSIAQLISFMTSASLSFVLNLTFTFVDKKLADLSLVYLKFTLVTIFFTFFSTFVITFLANQPYFKNKKLLSKLLVVGLTLPLTYFIYKYWVYQ
jgi:putative flippase GtrA